MNIQASIESVKRGDRLGPPAKHTPLHRSRISCAIYRASRAFVVLVTLGSRERTLRVPR